MRSVIKKYSAAKRGETSRKERVAETIRRILSEAFRDGALLLGGSSETSVTVGHVEISPDMRHAKVWVAPLGGAATQEFEDMMNACASRCNDVIAKNMPMKFTPKIYFKADRSFEKAASLAQVMRRTEEEVPGAPASEDSASSCEENVD